MTHAETGALDIYVGCEAYRLAKKGIGTNLLCDERTKKDKFRSLLRVYSSLYLLYC